MELAAVYPPPLRASMSPAESKRTITARSAKLPAVPVDSPVPPSMLATLGVASNAAPNAAAWLANAAFCHVAELIVPPGGGGCTTVTAAMPLLPSLVAVMVADPAATPVTEPLPFAVATPVSLLDHITTRSDSSAPVASVGIAVTCAVWPTSTVALGGATSPRATPLGGAVAGLGSQPTPTTAP